jgi:hypothetical protein
VGAIAARPLRQANTALVRTVQRLLVGVQADLPPHNFPVVPQVLGWDSSLKLFAGQSQSKLLGVVAVTTICNYN